MSDRHRSITGTVPPATSRRGSALAFTLLGCMIVATLGIGLLLAGRIENHRSRTTLESYEASLAAQAGLDMAFHHIANTANWRAMADGNEWGSPQPLGNAAYWFSMADPLDGDLTDSDYDPVVITATGVSGNARQKIRARFDVAQRGLDCLQSSIHANGDIVLQGVNATSDHWITANGNIVAEEGGNFPTHVHTDVAAAGSVQAKGDSVYHGATSLNVSWPLDMPDPDTVFDYYLANGTPIDINDIPLWERNLLDNPSIEGPPPSPPETGWHGYGGCDVFADASEQDDFAHSLRATNRSTPAAGPAQDISDKIVSGLTYHVMVRAGSVNEDKIDARLTIEWRSTEDPLQQWSSDWVELGAGNFDPIESADQPLQADSFTPTWNGTLVAATLRLETQSSLDDLRLDTASMVEWTPYGFVRTIHREVLSPNHNPFGFGDTNPEGIYIIDCQGGILSIQRSRIVGTLVVLNSHGVGTFIWSVVHWSPAVSNYPAIMSDGVINFHLANEADVELVEGSANTNYNPAGAPYSALWDDDRLDTYGSLMRGIVYSTDTIMLQYRPVLEGVLVCEGDVIGEANPLLGVTDLDVTYLRHYHNHAPPGFRVPPEFHIAPGSFQREID